MQLSSNKTKMTTATVLILLMASVMLTALPSMAQEVNEAHGGAPGTVTGGPLPAGVTPNVTVPEVAYLNFRPNPIGIGQTLLVNIWTSPPPAANRAHTQYKVTIMKPDGTTGVVGPMNSYVADGTAWFETVVDQIGTWKLKFDYPGDYYPAGTYINGVVNGTGTPLGFNAAPSTYPSTYFQPASTEWQNLTVQQDPILSWPMYTLPTDYWTRPISPEHREWYTIGGNYPPSTQDGTATRYAGPYVTGPTTAHIAWKRQGAVSGIIGGEGGQWSTTGGGGTPSIIYQGRAYQTFTKPGVGSVAQCYDLRTGQIFYEIPTASGGVTPTALSYVPTVGEVTGSEGGISVDLLTISGGYLIKVNPWSGLLSLNTSIAPLTTGTFYNNQFVVSVQTIGTGASARYRLINWTTAGTNTNFTSRIISNISFAVSSIPTPIDFTTCIGISQSRFIVGNIIGGRLYAVSLVTGQVLWNITTDETPYNPSSSCADYGKYACSVENRHWMCWDENTGTLLWKSPDTGYPFGDFWAYSTCSAYGQLYTFCYSGVFCFDWNTGKILWIYSSGDAGYETPYQTWSFNGAGIVANGIIYTYNTEHTPTQPITRGWKLHAINTTTGQGIWNMTGSQTPGPVADGYLTASNSYDGYMYVYGKGPSETSVSAPQTAVQSGTQVLIQGTILDQSLGQPGTPCVSKDSMATYMEYLHMQHPIDGLYHNVTVTGVPVTLLAINSNGTAINIGTAVSDLSGKFQYAWTPPNQGTYKITATFAGDDSYGSSWDETGLSVVPAPATPTTPQTEVPDYTMTIVYAAIAIIIAMIIAVAIVGILILRKK